ncbi:uncharacterized protein LOC112554894 [Pomacea canaliculata]|uniref:uncharacterized protein LOC112554894 n=1 Tax=Pomacea canaliculata TaxID=400727 RepID=UPI000D73F715|nr:uncharacterized protein LOC112554894 [Pomacea canaliculata]
MLLTFIVLCVVLSGVAFGIFAIYKFTQKENMQGVTDKEVSDGEQVFSGLLRVNETFTYEMANSRSPKFHSFQERFCTNIESVVTRNGSSGRCKVNSLSNGSIIVNFTLVITHPMSVNETRDLLLCLFNGTQVGTMRVDSQATQFTFNPDGNETIVSKERKSSSCSSDSLPISPMSYTYPDYCGDYQVCNQGNSVLQTCPEGEEFTYLSLHDRVICALPSSNTYCGMKRVPMMNTAHQCQWVAFSLCSGILIALTFPGLGV